MYLIYLKCKYFLYLIQVDHYYWCIHVHHINVTAGNGGANSVYFMYHCVARKYHPKDK